jgi:Sec-independent protein secretion pathway component TatC
MALLMLPLVLLYLLSILLALLVYRRRETGR